MAIESPTLTWAPKDYKSDLKPIWCAGCGDFGVLNALYKAMSMCNLDPENTVVVSGIGCSSRLPGFVASYGFHGVHGRALPIATGIKASRPELNVIVVGGDGDGYSIGAGHFPHAEEPVRVAEILRDFIATTEAAPSDRDDLVALLQAASKAG